MNFQAMDYLNGLNLDFDVSPNISENSNELDLFTHTEFFDLDVFAKDAPEGTKQQQAQFQTSPDAQFAQVPLPAQAQQQPLTQTSTPYIESSPQSTQYDATNDDKRRRNTAASARFRIKKKQKEQEMESKAKKLQDTVSNLEKKLKTLEMENKCLKNLILQQNERKNSDLLENIKKRSIESPVYQFTN
ncbi:transcriptional activator of sulfur metabolism Met28p [[Candida] railenensis]|uniref:Transcriptional activator of sulfur metabolism Met28p n=1 Tax=[Candida] railenensis TaxID=45579 RepID=A0A9P0QTJ5_9ASCO|nr:transcriptional activator of sulfur metabolism Met28p [[Candida] railenensis]